MSKKDKKELVPDLRFSEFKKTEGWTKTKLINVADKNIKWSFIGGPFGSNLKSSDYVSKGVRIIQLQNIGDAEFKDKYQIFTSEEKADELLSNNIYPGDIILSKMGDPVGRACLIPDTHPRYVMCSDGIRLVVDKSKFSKYFIYILINSDWFRASVEASATGSTRKRIGLDVLKKLPLVVPKKIEEQQKIADCLSSLDELIIAHVQKHEELQSYKKGLMQNLFPAEDEALPVLRFSGLHKSWKTKELGRISKILRGGSPRPIDEYITSEPSGLNWLKIADVNKKSKYVVSTKEKVLVTALSKTRVVNKGDLIMSNSMSFGRPYILKIKSCIHDGWIAITEINEKIYRDYLYYVILSPTSQSYFLNNAAGSGVLNLNADIIKLLPIPFPDHVEQKKIADLLSSVDDLIAVQGEKIEDLKSHKKGLMQQIFPAMDEVIT